MKYFKNNLIAFYQIGGKTDDDNVSSGRWRQVDEETITPEYSLPEVKIVGKHPIWDLPGYKGKEDKYKNLTQRDKDQIWKNTLSRNLAGLQYMKWAAPLAASPAIFIAGGLGAGSLLMNAGKNMIMHPVRTAAEFAGAELGGKAIDKGVQKTTGDNNFGEMIGRITGTPELNGIYQFFNPGYLAGGFAGDMTHKIVKEGAEKVAPRIMDRVFVGRQPVAVTPTGQTMPVSGTEDSLVQMMGRKRNKGGHKGNAPKTKESPKPVEETKPIEPVPEPEPVAKTPEPEQISTPESGTVLEPESLPEAANENSTSLFQKAKTKAKEKYELSKAKIAERRKNAADERARKEADNLAEKQRLLEEKLAERQRLIEEEERITQQMEEQKTKIREQNSTLEPGINNLRASIDEPNGWQKFWNSGLPYKHSKKKLVKKFDKNEAISTKHDSDLKRLKMFGVDNEMSTKSIVDADELSRQWAKKKHWTFAGTGLAGGTTTAAIIAANKNRLKDQEEPLQRNSEAESNKSNPADSTSTTPVVDTVPIDLQSLNIGFEGE